MKKLLFVFAVVLMLLPMVVKAQCGTKMVTDEAGNNYQTVTIGTHCWLKSNLKTYVPGSFIYYSDMYPDTTVNMNMYGRLYNWETAVKAPLVVNPSGNVQGICPTGWHIPSIADVQELTLFEAQATHSTTDWLIPGTNTTHYTQMPGGFYNANAHRCENLRGEAYFWSIGAEQNPIEVMSDCHCDMFLLNPGKVQNGLSVRCVEDIPAGITTSFICEGEGSGQVFRSNNYGVDLCGTEDQIDHVSEISKDNAKSQVDQDLIDKTAKVEKTTAYSNVSEEMIDVIDFAAEDDGLVASYDFLPAEGDTLTHLYVNNVDLISQIVTHSSSISSSSSITVSSWTHTFSTNSQVRAVFSHKPMFMKANSDKQQQLPIKQPLKPQQQTPKRPDAVSMEQ